MFKRRKRRRLSLKTRIFLYLAIFALAIVAVIYSSVTFSTKINSLKNSAQARAELREELSHQKYKEPEDDSSNDGGSNGGTGSGLNLLLIDDIKTEGYVKELLTLLRDSSQGKINDSEYHLSLDGYIGIQINETGSFFGVLPKAYIPTRGNEILWKKEAYGIPASDMTIKGLSGSQGITIAQNDPNSMYVGGTGYYGLFQTSWINQDIKANINWNGSDSSRAGSTFYYPDAISYLDWRASQAVDKYFDVPDKSLFETEQTLLNIIASGTHNAGELGFIGPLAYGTNYNIYPTNMTDDELNFESLYTLYKDLSNGVNKFPSVLKSPVSSAVSRSVVTFLLLENGWYLDTIGYNYISRNGGITDETASMLLGSGKTAEDLLNYFSSKVKPLPISSEEASKLYGWQSNDTSIQFYSFPKGAIYKYNDKQVELPSGYTGNHLMWLNMETAGQIFNSSFGGRYYYATALKYAGVGVDPTNPDDYMNTIPEGEWKPGQGGIKDTVKQMGYEIKNLTADREKLLDYALQFLGHPYCYGGDGRTITNPAETVRYIDELRQRFGNSPSNGYDSIDPVNKHKGMRLFDCSSFTGSMYSEALGIQLPRSSGAQISATNTSVIDLSKAKPGDLGGNSAHIVFFLANTPDGVLVLDQAMPGIDISVRIESNPNQYTWVTVDGVK